MKQNGKESSPAPTRHLSFDAWVDQVYQVMINDYPQLFGATGTESQLHRGDIDWNEWRPWYDEGLSAMEAVERSLVKD